MFFTNTSIFKTIFTIYLLLLSLACASTSNRDISALHWAEEDNSAKKVIILPFVNDTPEKDIEIVVRKSFYNHFSSKNYHDIELSEVDQVLTILHHVSLRTWRDLSPINLGELFHADYIIYGIVKKFAKIFMGIYSQIMLKVKLEIVEGKSGNVVWRKTIVKRSHEGGIPFNPFGILPAALRSGLHMKEERTLDLIDRLNRILAEQIPEPPGPATLPFFIDIQVASFSERERALKMIKEFDGKGYNPRLETVTLGDRLWHRILLGPYYMLSEAEKIRNAVRQNSKLQPIFIHHYPGTRDKGIEAN
ncbi:MAG: DUF799 family lipoprotein [Thermodesulfobacteriota bacterium]|nr:DUF799 family lipoprotein [Thermodesulfobacteriota bacterium]